MKLKDKFFQMCERNLNVVKNLINFQTQSPKTVVDPLSSYYNGTNASWNEFLNEQLQRNATDRVKYADYDLMDLEVPEISAALDVMSDYVVYPDNVNKTKIFKVKSNKPSIQKVIDEIDRTTNFHSEFHSMIREACKNGDNFEELLLEEKTNKIIGFKNIHTSSVIVNKQGGILDKNKAWTQIGLDQKAIADLKYNEALHFSLNTDRFRFSKYGKGVSRVERSRLLYRQLRLMEEGMMISRLSRSNQSYGIMVDVGDLMGDDALDYIDKYKKQIARKKYVDQSTGRMSYKYNPLSVIEDLYIPTRQGSGAGVQSLNNGDGVKNIDDINYFQNRLIYSTNVPKLLIGKEDDINSKSTAETQYICFLRMIRRIQTIVEPEIVRFYRIALLSRNINAPDLSIEWPLISTIDEERKWRIEQMKVNVGITQLDKALIDDYEFYKTFAGMNDDEINVLTSRLDATEQKYINAVEDAIEDGTVDGADDPNMQDDEESPSTTKKSKEDLNRNIMSQFKENLDKESYLGFEKLASLLETNPELKQLVGEYIQLTNAQLGV